MFTAGRNILHFGKDDHFLADDDEPSQKKTIPATANASGSTNFHSRYLMKKYTAASNDADPKK